MEIYYKTLIEAYCPYFKGQVSFNQKGFEHIEFKKRNSKRLQEDQYRRFRILKYAPIIISSSHTLQGKRNGRSFELVKNNSRWEYVLKDVTYFEFIAILDSKRIRVVIKQIENGNKFFWSIIPYWKTNKDNDRILHSGIGDEE